MKRRGVILAVIAGWQVESSDEQSVSVAPSGHGISRYAVTSW